MILDKAKSIIFIPWLAAISCLLGIFIFAGFKSLYIIFFSFAYLTLFLTIQTANNYWKDFFNPISIILSIAFIRFSLPGLLYFKIDSDIAIFTIMGLDRNDWILGHVLALIGLLCVVIGWSIHIKFPKSIIRLLFISTNIHFSAGVPYVAIVGMLIGFIALLLFIQSNATITEVIVTGEFRRTEIQQGTGKYFRLSLMLIASSVVFSAYAMSRKYVWWKTLLPNIIAMILFWVLGGRVRAFVPFAAGLLIFWYQKGHLKISVRGLILIVPLLPVFSFAGQLYRGGGGVEEILRAFSIPELLEYLKWALWVDWGQLHSLAGATAIGPWALGGRTFLTMLWPLSDILNLPGKSAGVFIAERLTDFGERKWGFHATLIGDAYLNFGLIGVIVVATIFGMLLKDVYTEMRRGLVNNAIYGLIVVYSVRIFFESIEKFTEALIVLIFAIFIIKLAQILFENIPNKIWANQKNNLSKFES